MTEFYNDSPIESVLDYLDVIIEYSQKEPSELWYRGHRNQEWKLRPSIFREAVLDMRNDGSVQPIRYKNFIDFINAVKKIKNANQQDRFNLFHYSFLAQHYGLPTPFLDWSTDPLVALYFALDGYQYNDEDNFPVVYILNPNRVNEHSMLNIFNSETNKVEDIREPFCVDDLEDKKFEEWLSDLNNTPFSLAPFAVKSNYDLRSHRISRQSGVFTIHEARYLKSPEWIFRVDENGNSMGIALKISPSKVSTIREQLKVLNLTHETVYGTELTKTEEIVNRVLGEIYKI